MNKQRKSASKTRSSIFGAFFWQSCGLCFGGIDDIIVNSVALGFLLQLDETITDAMMSAEAGFGGPMHSVDFNMKRATCWENISDHLKPHAL